MIAKFHAKYFNCVGKVVMVHGRSFDSARFDLLDGVQSQSPILLKLLRDENQTVTCARYSDKRSDSFLDHYVQFDI